MATLLLNAAGFAVGGPIGALIGTAIGNQIDNRLLGPGDVEREGPRLTDLSVQSSAYGAGIPLVYGRARIAGNVVWSTGLIERRSEETTEVGGKGGGGSVTTTTFQYSASFAVALAGRQLVRLERIWADGKLIRGATGPLSVGGEMRFYNGSEDQLPDPLIEAEIGLGGVPAFRGIVYVVFEGLELAEFANRIPNLSFELVGEDGAVTLAHICADLAQRSGLSADVTALSGTVAGYTVALPGTVRRALETLRFLSPFSLREDASNIVFRDRPTAVDARIEGAQLGAFDGEAPADPLTLIHGPDDQLPRDIAVHFFDPARDFQANVQRARLASANHEHKRSIRLPAAISADEAKRTAERGLTLAWRGRDRLQFSTNLSRLEIAPGDLVEVDSGGIKQLIVIEEQLFEGGLIRSSGPRVRIDDLANDARADGGADISQSLAPQGPTQFALFELPSSPGRLGAAPELLVAAAGEDTAWRSATLFSSLDDGATFAQVTRLAMPAVFGTTESALGGADPQIWDRGNKVVVQLLHDAMTLESRPELALLNGTNAALLGQEVIQFASAIQLDATRYEVSQLLRGRLATEAQVASHSAGEPFVLLDPNLLGASTLALGAVDQPRLYKMAGPNEDLANLAAREFAVSGRNLRPFSPVHVRAARLSNGDIEIAWRRRSRNGFAWLDGADAPLAEESERYDIEIMSGGGVTRSSSVTAPSAVYTLAEQTADFSGPATNIEFRVYQLSGAVGRGGAGTTQFSG